MVSCIRVVIMLSIGVVMRVVRIRIDAACPVAKAVSSSAMPCNILPYAIVIARLSVSGVICIKLRTITVHTKRIAEIISIKSTDFDRAFHLSRSVSTRPSVSFSQFGPKPPCIRANRQTLTDRPPHSFQHRLSLELVRVTTLLFAHIIRSPLQPIFPPELPQLSATGPSSLLVWDYRNPEPG